MNKRILVVEDEEQIRQYISTALSLNNYEVSEAENGKIALDKALQIMPDLIISDIMMPVMDGLELLTELHANQSTCNIPMLFLTARADQTDIRIGMKLGADDYLTKPFDIDELLESVNSQLKKSEKREALYKQKFEDLRANIRKALPHEIRTPLSIILGFSELLMKKDDKLDRSEIRDMIYNIHSSAKRLNHLLENYLLYANLEIIATNQIEKKNLLKQITFSAKDILENTVTYLSQKYERTNDVILEIDEDKCLAISETYFLKIIEEVFDNCLKYSPKETPIVVRGKSIGDEFIMNFIDQGRGMTNEQIQNIGAYIQFERRIYEQQGAGLGMTIAKRITELHSGTFMVSSEPQQFTNVEIHLLINDSI